MQYLGEAYGCHQEPYRQSNRQKLPPSIDPSAVEGLGEGGIWKRIPPEDIHKSRHFLVRFPLHPHSRQKRSRLRLCGFSPCNGMSGGNSLVIGEVPRFLFRGAHRFYPLFHLCSLL
ncbi:hypothetical protein D3C75_915400 [compost metagenome]